MRDRGRIRGADGPVRAVREARVSAEAVADCAKDEHGVFRKPGTIGTFDGSEESRSRPPNSRSSATARPLSRVDGEIKEGFPTPSKEARAVLDHTLKEWGWPEYSTPKWIPSHVHWEDLDLAGTERILLPTFRIPTLIHTRSANSKWLNEISHRHPLWIHPSRC